MRLRLSQAWFGLVGVSAVVLCVSHLLEATRGSRFDPPMLVYGLSVGIFSIVVAIATPIASTRRMQILLVGFAIVGCSPFVWLAVIVAAGAQSAAAYAIFPIAFAVIATWTIIASAAARLNA
jgi:hypothetical protein